MSPDAKPLGNDGITNWTTHAAQAAKFPMNRMYAPLLLLLLAGCTSMGTAGSKEVATISAERRPLIAKVEDVESFFAQVFTNDLRKSEFETQVEYTTRLRRLQPAATNVFFKVSPGLVEYVYNAEKQTLVVMAKTSPSYEHLERPDSPTLTIHFGHNKPSEPENGRPRTLAAARAAVRSSGYTPYKLRILNFLELPLNTRWKKADQRNEVGLGLAFAIPSEEAKAAVTKKSVTLILGVTIGDLSTEGHFSSQTMVFDPSNQLPARLTALIVLDQSSGTVLASWSKER